MLPPAVVQAISYSRRATAMHGHGSIVETVGTFSGPSFRGERQSLRRSEFSRSTILLNGGRAERRSRNSLASRWALSQSPARS
jgi:hypothetical protein